MRAMILQGINEPHCYRKSYDKVLFLWVESMDWKHLKIAEEFVPSTILSKANDKSYHIVVSDGEILCIDGQHPWRPLNQEEWRWCGLDSVSSHYLGNIGQSAIFAEEVDEEIESPPGYEFDTLWSFLTTVDQPVFYLIGRAKQIVEWHQHHQFCGSCGSATSVVTSDRSRKCGSCKISFYPRLSPSIIVLVHRHEQILLAKNAATKSNFYSTLAGFVEPGESIEETVHREVYEEVGITVKNLNYFKSQSWPFPNSLMLGFYAEYEGGEITIQEEEIADAQWFHYRELPNRPAMMSISGWLIAEHIKRLEG